MYGLSRYIFCSGLRTTYVTRWDGSVSLNINVTVDTSLKFRGLIMFGILKWECIVHGKELENVKQDRKHSKRIERYEVSENAIYFDGKYLPVSLIKSMRSQPSAYRPHGCCGIGIPVFKIRVEYGAEKPLVLVIEQEEKVEELLNTVIKANPDITLEYYLSPHTGLKPEKISPPLY